MTLTTSDRAELLKWCEGWLEANTPAWIEKHPWDAWRQGCDFARALKSLLEAPTAQAPGDERVEAIRKRHAAAEEYEVQASKTCAHEDRAYLLSLFAAAPTAQKPWCDYLHQDRRAEIGRADRATAQAPRVDADDTVHLQTIDERDAAEEALSQAFYIVTGRSPEWSNLFGHDEALEEIGETLSALKQRARSTPPSPSPTPAHSLICNKWDETNTFLVPTRDCDCGATPAPTVTLDELVEVISRGHDTTYPGAAANRVMTLLRDKGAVSR